MKVGTLAFPLSLLRRDAFSTPRARWDAAISIGQMMAGRWLTTRHPDEAEEHLSACMEKHPQTPARTWKNLSRDERAYAVGFRATGWFFTDGVFHIATLNELLRAHAIKGQPLIILPTDKLTDWRNKSGDEQLRHAVCAVRSIVGAKPFARVTTTMIAARMIGFPSPSKATGDLPSRKTVRTLLDRMAGEVARVYVGGKFTWMSTRLTLDELKAAVITRKAKRCNSCNLTESGAAIIENPNGDTGAAIIDAGRNNNEGPQEGHDGAAKGPQGGRNNLDSETWIPKSGFSDLDSSIAARADSTEEKGEGDSDGITLRAPTADEARTFAESLFKEAGPLGAEWFDLHGDDPSWAAKDWKLALTKFVFNRRQDERRINRLATVTA
jgi:hypothetical protein